MDTKCIMQRLRLIYEIDYFQFDNLNNSRWFKRKVRIPPSSKIDVLVDRIVYILRQLELIRSIKNLNRLTYNILPVEIRHLAKNMSENQVWKAKEVASEAFALMLEDGLTQSNIDNLDEHLNKYLPDNLSNDQRELISLIIKKIAKANVIIDEDQIKKLRKREKNC